MSACIKRRILRSEMILGGTFLVAFFLSCHGTFADTPIREIGLTTYLRDGPGIRYRPVDEAETGTAVSVVNCANNWCRILDGGVSGFVAQSALALRTNPSAPMSARVCTVGQEASYHGNRGVLFCRSGIPAKPGRATSRP